MKQIVDKIILHKIDMKDIVLNPTEDNLNKALKVLEFPKKATIKSGFAAKNKDIELPITQFFSLNKPKPSVSEKGGSYKPGYSGYFFKNISGHSINEYLENFLLNIVKSDYFIGLGKEATQYIVALEDRIRLFNKLVQTPQEQFNFTVEQLTLLTSTYPLIFVSEASTIRPFGNEYRNSVPSKLGDDIRMVATDTIGHRDHLKKYIRKHQVGPVQVVLFSDLEHVSHDKSNLPLSIDSQQLRNMLIKTKHTKHGRLFYKLYELLDDLNDKRNNFRYNNPKAYESIGRLLSEINHEMDTAFPLDKPVSKTAVRAFCFRSIVLIKEQKNILEQHRSILGILDTVLTVLASLIILYPVVYFYQKANSIQHTFFNTNSGIITQYTVNKLTEDLTEINTSAHDFPEGEGVKLLCSA